MKQVKKLLVILPLVALFVLGSLPVLAALGTGVKVVYDGEEVVDGQTLTKTTEKVKYDESKIKITDADGNDVTANYDKMPEPTTEADQFTVTVVNPDNQSEKMTFTVKGTPKTSGGNQTAEAYKLIVEYYLGQDCKKPAEEKTRTYTLDEEFFKDVNGQMMVNKYANVKALAKSIEELVMAQLQNGFKEDPDSFATAAETFLKGESKEATVRLYLPKADTVKVIAYDIHNNRFVYDRLFKLEMKDGWKSEKDASEAFYNNTVDLQRNYLYAGYASKEVGTVILYRGAYLEQIAEHIYLKALDTYKADVVAFVVPRTIDVKTIHVFPEGTRDELIEYVPVPYEVWASLQHSWKFMDLPSIFKTRIQKVNEMGFTFREINYYNGLNPITGLVSGYDWYGFLVAGDGDNDFCARVFYDKAVAAAKEVPTEKKVDAATAPQAQTQAPAGQAPVTAANTTTTTAPANTLPVTGASDSIFLFLSSAALMAVGILFFKKH